MLSENRLHSHQITAGEVIVPRGHEGVEPATVLPDSDNGGMIRSRITICEQPSILPPSASESGMVSKWPLRSHTANGRANAVCARTIAEIGIDETEADHREKNDRRKEEFQHPEKRSQTEF